MAVLPIKKDITTYNVLDDVRKEIPGDSEQELLCLQYVFPTINGVPYPDAASYRFIRYSTKDQRLKSQMGQAQVPELETMAELILEMAKKRSLEGVMKVLKEGLKR